MFYSYLTLLSNSGEFSLGASFFSSVFPVFPYLGFSASVLFAYSALGCSSFFSSTFFSGFLIMVMMTKKSPSLMPSFSS